MIVAETGYINHNGFSGNFMLEKGDHFLLSSLSDLNRKNVNNQAIQPF